MLGFEFAQRSGRALEVLCIGAHCDDIEIGCGGTLLELQRAYPGSRIHWIVLTSAPERYREGMRAARAFLRRSVRATIDIGALRDGFLPDQFGEVKERFERLKDTIAPDLILTHHECDRHQDHRLLSDLTWQTFRDHLIWEYEIPKYDGGLTTPNVYIPLGRSVAARKADTLMKSFASQRHKTWFTRDNFFALMRLRGLECRSPSGFAEGFHCRKLVGSLSRRAPRGR